MTATAAQNGGRIVFIDSPDFRRVNGMFGVALETRKPLPAALEFDGNNVNVAVIMSASRLRINIFSVNLRTVNHFHC
jgi:hypothetical protein